MVDYLLNEPYNLRRIESTVNPGQPTTLETQPNLE